MKGAPSGTSPKLTSKVDGKDPVTPTDTVSVYGFMPNGQRVQLGFAKAGDEIVLDNMRPVGKAIYYSYAWTGSKNQSDTKGPPQEYWVSGSNIEFAGKK